MLTIFEKPKKLKINPAVKITQEKTNLLNLKALIKTYKLEIKLVRIENHSMKPNISPSDLSIKKALYKSGRFVDGETLSITKFTIKIRLISEIEITKEFIFICFFENSLLFSKIKLLEKTILYET